MVVPINITSAISPLSVGTLLAYWYSVGEIPIHPNVAIVSHSLVSVLELGCEWTQCSHMQTESAGLQESHDSVPGDDVDLVIFTNSFEGWDARLLAQKLATIVNDFSPKIVLIISQSDTAIEKLLEWKELGTHFCLNCKTKLYVHLQMATESLFIEVYVQPLKGTLDSTSTPFVDQVSFGESYVKRRRNFKQLRIRVAHMKEWNIKTRSGWETARANPGTVTITYQYLAYMQDFLNFQLETVSIHSKAESELESNGTWTGLAGLVGSGSVQLSITSSAMLQRLATDFRFLTPQTYEETPTMTFFAPDIKTQRPQLYVSVFQSEVWIVVGLLLGVVFLGRVFISGETTVSFWYTVAYFLLQEWPQSNPITGYLRRSQIRTLMISLGLMCWVLYAIFSSKFISSLSIQRQQIEPGLSDLIAKGTRFGICDTSYLPSAAKFGEEQDEDQTHSNCNKIIDRLFTNLDPDNQFPFLDDGLKLMYKNRKYALVCEESVYTPLYQQFSQFQICDEIQISRLPEYGVKLGPFVAKGSEWSQYFNYARISMKERGLTHLFLLKQKQYHEDRLRPCERARLRSFDLVDVTLPFHILSAGIITSFACVFIEKVHNFIMTLIHRRETVVFVS